MKKFLPIVNFKILGRSMEPIYKNGQRILVNRWAYLFLKPRYGDVVVIKHPQKNIRIVKRIIKISKNMYFVAGDNSNSSIDSRHFGFIHKKQIIGKVI